MKFYDFNEIRAAGDCIKYVETVYGVVVRNGRCAAVWRGGTNPESVSIDKYQWYDHGAKVGGGIIELAAYKTNGDIQLAQYYLGQAYGLTPKMLPEPQPEPASRYAYLIQDGFKEVARYEYRDDGGTVRHITVRLEHPDHPGKQFVQGTPADDGRIRWSLKGIETVLYRLPEISSSGWVLVCEGEKSANRLAELGLPTTTAPMGAGKWKEAYTEVLSGKFVAIAPDNDIAGVEHANLVARALHGKAKEVRIVGPLSIMEKGGIDDWLDEEPGRGAQAVLDAISAAPIWFPPDELVLGDSAPPDDAMQKAKTANSIPFRNYIPRETETERRGKKVTEVIKEPRSHQAMLDDLSLRFLGFPRRVGDSILFDHDRDTGAIIYIRNAESLLAWISRRSKRNPEFARGDAFATPKEVLESIYATCRKYEAISITPDFPHRDDVYYTHGDLPPSCPDLSRLNTLAGFFLPETREDAFLIRTLICAPLWFVEGLDRPAWIIDSKDGQETGKSKLAELVSDLYGHAPISTTKYGLSQNFDQLIKRCVSYTGRHARVMLIDNVTGNFDSPELSDLITSKDITGMAPYGRGAEVRKNNLTYIITANTATVSTDISSRSLYIHLRKPPADIDHSGWKQTVQDYIRDHRMEIFADIISLLSRRAQFAIPPRTRFQAWEAQVLQPCCEDPETYLAVLDRIFLSREESNVEHDQANSISEIFDDQIKKALGSCVRQPVFIRSEVVNSWGRQALNDAMGGEFKGRPIQLIRNLAKAGFLPRIDRSLRRWPRSSGHGNRPSGIAWDFEEVTEQAIVIGRRGNGEIFTEVA